MWTFWGAITQPAIVQNVVSYMAFKDTRWQGNVRERAPHTVKFNQQGRVDRSKPGRDVSFLFSLWMTAPRRGFPLQPGQRHPTWKHTHAPAEQLTRSTVAHQEAVAGMEMHQLASLPTLPCLTPRPCSPGIALPRAPVAHLSLRLFLPQEISAGVAPKLKVTIYSFSHLRNNY